jgi:hypothetical protein
MNKSTRTQIILPTKLRTAIDAARNVRGESLAEYLRVAAEERLAREKKRRTDLRALANRVVGAVPDGSWSREDVMEWQRDIRRDRDL